MSIFIGGAWPYANGSLHLGHIASLLPGDILARYYRAKGENVLYVSGSDCNGTPIAIRAKQEGVTAKEIANKYHEEFQRCFRDLGFTYDCYTRTDSEHHHETVQKVFLRLLEEGYIYKKTVEQAYCETCTQFLRDRYVEGICPYCHEAARGDQCDACSAILDPLDLLEKKCKLCGSTPSVEETEHFYFALHTFQEQIKKVVEIAKEKGTWREFIYSHNSELLGAYGNFVNRTLKFIEKYYDGTVPKGTIDIELKDKVEGLYKNVGEAIEQTKFKVALETIFDAVRFANKYFDEKQPWKQREDDPVSCEETIYNCVYLIANFANLLEPFLPFSSERVRSTLSIIKRNWEPQNTLPSRIDSVQPLFERIDVKQIEHEVGKLYGAVK
ncbi:methionine--tRNA ligase [Bacillus thuringiensis]|uniref:methionine--tRNA ligase n=1 Tax=Bacillus thuringiensis TaxID=1428 RepID=UPI000BF7009C|nr:class I tRNA ligase family protein [Bacillus thuringiensis]PFA82145.1 hypothetical protein CN400_22365 [Bacillus thuringiensis]